MSAALALSNVLPLRWATEHHRDLTGVLTGVALARHEKIVIADDDVRYERDGLQRTNRV